MLDIIIVGVLIFGSYPPSFHHPPAASVADPFSLSVIAVAVGIQSLGWAAAAAAAAATTILFGCRSTGFLYCPMCSPPPDCCNPRAHTHTHTHRQAYTHNQL